MSILTCASLGAILFGSINNLEIKPIVKNNVLNFRSAAPRPDTFKTPISALSAAIVSGTDPAKTPLIPPLSVAKELTIHPALTRQSVISSPSRCGSGLSNITRSIEVPLNSRSESTQNCICWGVRKRSPIFASSSSLDLIASSFSFSNSAESSRCASVASFWKRAVFWRSVSSPVSRLSALLQSAARLSLTSASNYPSGQ